MSNSKCEEMKEALSAYADGELQADERETLEAHLAGCSNCKTALQATIAIERRLRALCAEERAPEGLWDKVSDSISDASVEDVETVTKTGHFQQIDHEVAGRGPRIGRRGMAALAAGVVLALGAGVTLPYWRRIGGQNPLVVEPVNDFITFKASERPLDMAASDPVKLKQWFNGKVDFRLPLDHAETEGFRLIGSRLCYFLNRRLSALMYERSGTRVSLYVMTGEGLEIPEGTWESSAGRAISSFHVKGYSNLIWQDGDLVYALVSDQPKNDMLRFIAGLKLETAATSGSRRGGPGRENPDQDHVCLPAKNGPGTMS